MGLSDCQLVKDVTQCTEMQHAACQCRMPCPCELISYSLLHPCHSIDLSQNDCIQCTQPIVHVLMLQWLEAPPRLTVPFCSV